MLLEIIQQARLKLGFHTNVEHMTHRGMVELNEGSKQFEALQTLIRAVREGCQVNTRPSSRIFLWALRHAGKKGRWSNGS